MTRESRGLGRGLEALLGNSPRASVTAKGGTLPLASIRTGSSQPRKTIHRQPLEELAASIKANGVIQPIVVRPLLQGAVGTATYEIVAGERRWQAAKLAGLVDIPVVIRELTDQQAVAVALIENIQREELTPAEEARALQRLIEEFTLTHQEVAEAVGRSRASVSNLLRLLDLPAEVLALIDTKALSMGHARALLGLDTDAERIRLAKIIAERGLSVRETESLVRKALQGQGRAVVVKTPPELSVVSEVIRTRSVHAVLHQQASGAGKLILEFKDAASRDALVEAVKKAVDD